MSSSSNCAPEAKELEEKCDQYIKEVMKSPKEYTPNDLEGLQQSFKDELLKLLKKYDVHPTKLANYQHGFSTKLEANKRLIVYEEGDQTKCREYSAYRAYDQFCLQCRSLSNHKVLIYARLIHGILFVPMNHICDPKEYAAVKEVQEKLKAGDAKGALSLQRKYAVKKHPRFLNSSPKPRKRSKASSPTTNDRPSKVAKKEKDTVAAAASSSGVVEDDNIIDLKCTESSNKEIVADGPSLSSQLLAIVNSAAASPANDDVDVDKNSDVSPKSSEDNLAEALSPSIPLGVLELEKTVKAAKTDMNQTTSEAPSPSASDSHVPAPSDDPTEPSSSTGGGGRGKGRKRGSKNLLYSKNSLDLIDAIKCLLPPEEEGASAPKKRRRRRKASIQAALEAASKKDDDTVDLIPSTNATASILDMIDTELLNNNEKYMSEHSTTSDGENTDDCEIIEENLYYSIQNQYRAQRTRTETITIED